MVRESVESVRLIVNRMAALIVNNFMHKTWMMFYDRVIGVVYGRRLQHMKTSRTRLQWSSLTARKMVDRNNVTYVNFVISYDDMLYFYVSTSYHFHCLSSSWRPALMVFCLYWQPAIVRAVLWQINFVRSFKASSLLSTVGYQLSVWPSSNNLSKIGEVIYFSWLTISGYTVLILSQTLRLTQLGYTGYWRPAQYKGYIAQSSTKLSRASHSCCRCAWSSTTPLHQHRLLGGAACRQPSFPGCCTSRVAQPASRSYICSVTVFIPATSENISFQRSFPDVIVTLQWTQQQFSLLRPL